MSRDNWKLVTIFESAMRADADLKVQQLFNEQLLNHMMQFEAEDPTDPDVDTRMVKYRVTIEAIDEADQ